MKKFAIITAMALCVSCTPRNAATAIADEVCKRAAVQSAEVGAVFAPMFAEAPDLMSDYQFCSMLGRPGAPHLVAACMTAVDHVVGRLSPLMRYVVARKLAERHGMPLPKVLDHQCVDLAVESFGG